ncbi:conserved membrane hypothetical protein [Vibrio chagasii]|nr:conserved membrane hypothetical protein [Vibrio chagasii]
MHKFVLNNERLLKMLAMMLIILSGITLYLKPLNFGIEFTGGVVIETAMTGEELQNSDIFSIIGVSVDASDYGSTIKVAQSEEGFVPEMKAFIGSELLSEEVIGASLGQEMVDASIQSIAIALIAMSLYLAIRYNLLMAFAAIFALVMDLTVSLGFLSLIGLEFNTLIVGAMMTVIGYSINDSVVTLDKVREVKRARQGEDIGDLYKTIVDVIFKRTMITSSSTLLVLLALALFGGNELSGFAITLGIGVMSGTLSSLVVVLAICSWASKRNPEFIKFNKKPSMEGDL